jgi:DDE superfamily endonuclease
MEDVLALYAMPYDARYPTVCLDEKPVVLHADVHPGLPLVPGQVERRDYEYERHGTANLFVLVDPLAGWRHVLVTKRRTKRDYAEVLRYLVEERYPDAQCICVVQDNLNTHTAGALYETFPPKQARHILASLEFHYTPKQRRHQQHRPDCLDESGEVRGYDTRTAKRGRVNRLPDTTPNSASSATGMLMNTTLAAASQK